MKRILYSLFIIAALAPKNMVAADETSASTINWDQVAEEMTAELKKTDKDIQEIYAQARSEGSAEVQALGEIITKLQNDALTAAQSPELAQLESQGISKEEIIKALEEVEQRMSTEFQAATSENL